MTIRCGLIGAGRMGKVFAHTLAFKVKEADLVAVADTDEEAAIETAARYNARDAYQDYRILLDRKDIQAVIIATPTGTHAELIQCAAEAGKQIFSEKPLALTLEGCDRALESVEKARVKLQVGFMRRYDPAYRLAKLKIDEGVIGKPVMFKSIGRDPKRTSLDFARRENSGGLIMDMGIHDFDLARWMMGSEVQRVYSEGDCLVYPELKEAGDIDNAIISLRYDNGALGHVDVSRNAVYGYDIRTEVLGSEGGLQIGKLQQTAMLVLTREGVSHDTIPYFMERFGEAYADEITDFIRSIEENVPPAVSGQDARLATAIGLAATKSLDEGRPVELKEVLSKA